MSDLSAKERIIAQQIAAYQLRLAACSFRDLKSEAAKLHLACKRNAKQPIIDALIVWRRAKLEEQYRDTNIHG